MKALTRSLHIGVPCSEWSLLLGLSSYRLASLILIMFLWVTTSVEAAETDSSAFGVALGSQTGMDFDPLLATMGVYYRFGVVPLRIGATGWIGKDAGLCHDDPDHTEFSLGGMSYIDVERSRCSAGLRGGAATLAVGHGARDTWNVWLELLGGYQRNDVEFKQRATSVPAPDDIFRSETRLSHEKRSVRSWLAGLALQLEFPIAGGLRAGPSLGVTVEEQTYEEIHPFRAWIPAGRYNVYETKPSLRFGGRAVFEF